MTDVLRDSKLSSERLKPAEFEKLVDELSNRVLDCRYKQWSHRTNSRTYLQNIV